MKASLKKIASGGTLDELNAFLTKLRQRLEEATRGIPAVLYPVLNNILESDGSKITDSDWNELLLDSIETYQGDVFASILGECRSSITADTWNKAFIKSVGLMESAFSFGAGKSRAGSDDIHILHQVYQWPQSSNQSSWMLKIIEEAPNGVITQESWEEARGGSYRIDKLKIAFVTSILAKKPAVTDKILANVPKEKLSDYWNSAFASMSFSDKPMQMLSVLDSSGNMITRENLVSASSIYEGSFHSDSMKRKIRSAIDLKLAHYGIAAANTSGTFVEALKTQRDGVRAGAGRDH
jgi:hypothetical protein